MLAKYVMNQLEKVGTMAPPPDDAGCLPTCQQHLACIQTFRDAA